ncbi:Erythrocyte binding protein [Plasmodium coatneyi]|uniref:Erythrocyte binding protein n=1 Tax=Plasmodium coatneyi TaxID=208452 RepID=A0A1B1DW65_9APIC|nr:Erythrocyte binding protein [Plasmodium coatneyi]ANQ06994.1 Erythrocyte binding protein [Plasmodium coatneyi]
MKRKKKYMETTNAVEIFGKEEEITKLVHEAKESIEKIMNKKTEHENMVASEMSKKEVLDVAKDEMKQKTIVIHGKNDSLQNSTKKDYAEKSIPKEKCYAEMFKSKRKTKKQKKKLKRAPMIKRLKMLSQPLIPKKLPT